MKDKKQHNPFLTPEGYFDGFTARLMERIHEEERAKKRRRMTLITRYAAVLVVAVGIGSAWWLTRQSDKVLASDEYSQEYVNDALDYALISNTDIELYLTQAQ